MLCEPFIDFFLRSAISKFKLSKDVACTKTEALSRSRKGCIHLNYLINNSFFITANKIFLTFLFNFGGKGGGERGGDCLACEVRVSPYYIGE